MKDISGSSLSDKYLWLSLYLIKGIGNSTFFHLIRSFSCVEEIFCSDQKRLISLGIKEEVARNIVKRVFKKDPEKELKRIEEVGARIITYNDKTYPEILRNIHYPPPVLYVKGRDIPEDSFLLSIVGSRIPSLYGIRIAEDFSYRLAKIGIGIVSGMAIGIDSSAHRGALKAGGYTVAVLGTGIDVVYPKRNSKLFEQISESGTLITEFTTGTPPEPKNFPIRNRIISGLSRGVLVVEATRKSGSLITASFALDQGREVFAVPGNIDSERSRGTHFLIKQGAKLVEDIEDILEEFGIRIEEKESLKLSPEEKKIYECLDYYQPLHVDEIVRKTGFDTAYVLSLLLKMELKGAVKQIPGKMFIKDASKRA